MPENKIRRRIAGLRSVKRKRPACAIHRRTAGRQSAKLRPRHDVMRPTRPTDLIGKLMRAVVLIPIGPAAAESVETGDTKVGDARVVISRVAVEIWDSEVRAGCLVACRGEGIDGVSIEEVPANTEVIHQVWRQSVHIAEDVVRYRRGRNGAIDWNRTPAECVPLLPVGANVQADFVADILIDPVHRLVVAGGSRYSDRNIARQTGEIRRRIVLLELLGDRRNAAGGNYIARERGVPVQRIFDGSPGDARSRHRREIAIEESRRHLRR